MRRKTASLSAALKIGSTSSLPLPPLSLSARASHEQPPQPVQLCLPPPSSSTSSTSMIQALPLPATSWKSSSHHPQAFRQRAAGAFESRRGKRPHSRNRRRWRLQRGQRKGRGSGQRPSSDVQERGRGTRNSMRSNWTRKKAFLRVLISRYRIRGRRSPQLCIYNAFKNTNSNALKHI